MRKSPFGDHWKNSWPILALKSTSISTWTTWDFVRQMLPSFCERCCDDIVNSVSSVTGSENSKLFLGRALNANMESGADNMDNLSPAISEILTYFDTVAQSWS